MERFDDSENGSKEPDERRVASDCCKHGEILVPLDSGACDFVLRDFSVGDLKALLIKTYENHHVLKQFGENFAPGLDFDRMYPEQFHRAVQHEIFENHRLMVFDNDPTEQVWNTPAYRAVFEIAPDAHDAGVMHVTAFVWGVSAFIPNPDFVGTLTVKYIYTYELYGNAEADGNFKVAWGEWTGDSKTEHPNFVSVLTHDSSHSSNNLEIITDSVEALLAGGQALQRKFAK